MNRIRPKDHIELLRGVLPERYLPLQSNGNGIRSVYLTEIPAPLAETLAGLNGREASIAMQGAVAAEVAQHAPQFVGDDLDAWEHKLEVQIETSPSVAETE
jgi:putative restriction endonuclease